MSLRMDKVNSQIKKKLMEIIQDEVDDPRLDFVSITRVDTTADLRESKVYFSVLDNDFARIDTIFSRMKGFLRAQLGKRVRLKILPQLTFVPDESIKYSVEICDKIEKLKDIEKGSSDNAG